MQLEQLSAFNDEILALSRAGVPLATGLGMSREQLPGELSRVMEHVSASLAAGATLDEAIEKLNGDFPSVYVAMVKAGLASGQLPAALEGSASLLQRLGELRGAIGSAMIYPLILIVLAAILFAFVVQRTFAALQFVAEFHRLEMPGWFHLWVGLLADHGWWLLVMVCLLVIFCFGCWWSTGSTRLAREWLPGAQIFGWIPGVRRLIRLGHLATFTKTMELLLEQGVPLERSLALAGAATGDQRIVQEAGSLANSIHQGSQSDASSAARRTGLPRLLSWSIRGGTGSVHLPELMRRQSEIYFRDMRDYADWLRATMPFASVVLIGGSIAIVYALSFLTPWYYLLSRLTEAV